VTDLLQRLKEHVVIFDGAMGTMIYERGVFINTSYDELCLTRPDIIVGIHRDYIAAGAEVIETNTFGANRIKLGGHGLAEKTVSINAAAAKLAREAANGNALVAGSVGPCTRSNETLHSGLEPLVEAAFLEQVTALADGGVDCIIFETFTKINELRLALRAAQQVSVPVLALFSIDQEGTTPMGTLADSFVQMLDEHKNVGALGINCGIGPAGALGELERIVNRTAKPVIAMPNAGFPRDVEGRLIYLASPEYFAEYAKRFVDIGVRGVGGCCGTTPRHIKVVSQTLKGAFGVKTHIEVREVGRPSTAITVIPKEKKSRFSAKMASGESVTSVELLPPKSIDMTGFIAKAAECAKAGVDVINIPDGPRASLRLSPLIAAITMLREAKIEPVLHYCCRDRNLIGMQADILGGYAAGVANFLIITGDPPKLGDYPNATGVFDVDSIGLTKAVFNLNMGIDIGGARVAPPTGIFIGVGANPCALDLKKELTRLQQKIDAGAEYAITQPVFDIAALNTFLDAVDRFPLPIPIIAGIWPLTSFRNAEFMNNEVPGVVVPSQILDRMRSRAAKEDAIEEGITIAREMMTRIRDRVRGFQVSAPFGRIELALKVLEKR
jgi:methionine synthase I (cobalamin-dependent)/5,10-methylenetetrahydrofolate reductase